MTAHTLRTGGGRRCPACIEAARITHGLSDTPAYWTWANMRARCLSPSHPKWHAYGGRGIKICERWEDFETFHRDILELGYAEGLEMHRVDNDGDYGPHNVVFLPPADHRTTTAYLKAGNTGLPEDVGLHLLEQRAALDAQLADVRRQLVGQTEPYQYDDETLPAPLRSDEGVAR